MRSPLLEYEPEIHRLLPAQALPAHAAELAVATELLERIDTGSAGVDDEAYIVELIDQAVARSAPGPRRLSRPMVGALAHVLGLAARRVLRRRRTARIGAVGRLFALELEGLSPEDQLFEVSRQFVRLIRDAARRAVALDHRAMTPDGRAVPNRPSFAPSAQAIDRAAHRAVHAAAVELAPGLAPLVAAHRGATPASAPFSSAWAASAPSTFAGGATASSSVSPRRNDTARARRVRSFEGV